MLERNEYSQKNVLLAVQLSSILPSKNIPFLAKINNGISKHLLQSLNTIHHSVIRLVIGAFPTSPILSILCKADELPLQSYWNLTILKTLALSLLTPSPSFPLCHFLASTSTNTYQLYLQFPFHRQIFIDSSKSSNGTDCGIASPYSIILRFVRPMHFSTLSTQLFSIKLTIQDNFITSLLVCYYVYCMYIVYA